MKKNLNVILAATGASMTLLGASFGWLIFPRVLEYAISLNAALVPGTEVRDLWQNTPFPLEFKIYVFNVTNYKDVLRGATAEVKEIGPYVYDEWKSKVNVRDHPEDDTVSFRMLNKWMYNKEKSGLLTGDEVVVTPHPAIIGMIIATERDKGPLLPVVNQALPRIFKDQNSIFLTTKVKDLLFDGNIIDCTVKDLIATSVCAVMKVEAKDLEVVKKDVYKFSIFGHRNDTPDVNLFHVRRGSQNYNDVGRMLSLNKMTELNVWPGADCNELRGTDSTVFPPMRKPSDPITAFSVELCMSIDTFFEEEAEFKGVKVLKYIGSLGDMSQNQNQKCFCLSKKSCLKKGVIDLMPCIGAPIMASLPHFYDSHKDYLNGVIGLNPEKDKHELYFYLEPFTGAPLVAKKRLQFSLPVYPVKGITWTKNLQSSFIPLLWVEEGVEMSDDFMNHLDGLLFQNIRIVEVVKWLLSVGGIFVTGSSVYVNYKKKQNERRTKLEESPASSVTNVSENHRDSKTEDTENMKKKNEMTSSNFSQIYTIDKKRSENEGSIENIYLQ